MADGSSTEAVEKNPASATEEERQVLDMLAAATNVYFKLPEEHPVERDEWILAVHRLQDLIAVRVARRVDPDIWTQWKPA